MATHLGHPYEIDITTFRRYLSQYSKHIPESLVDLEAFRMEHLPATLNQGKAFKANALNDKTMTDIYIDREQLGRLVDWKLKHGVHRPSLAKLILANTDDQVKKATSTGFASYEATGDIHAAIAKVAVLRGVGPATASLVMASYSPDHIGFLGDEVARWLMWDDPVFKPGRGWDRALTYSAKEYRRYTNLLDAFMRRLDVKAVEVEKVGYVLGKLRIDINPHSSPTTPSLEPAAEIVQQVSERKQGLGQNKRQAELADYQQAAEMKHKPKNKRKA